MEAVVGIISRCVLKIEGIVKTNLIRVSYCCISCSFHCNSYLKQLYIARQGTYVSYNTECSVTCIKVFKEELAWAIEKWLWVISNITLLNQASACFLKIDPV